MENLLTIDASAASHVGMVRAVNTDNFFLNGRYIRDFETDSIQVSAESSGSEYLFAVTDGMDEVSEDKNASISAVKELKKLQERFRTNTKDFESKVEALKGASEELSNLIHSMTLGVSGEAVRKPSMAGLLFSHNKAGLVCLGNCRIYLYCVGVMRQLISDAKKAERLLRMGIITNDQVEMLRGGTESGKNDCKKTDILNLRLGDTFLICSNGVAELVDDDILSDIISMNESSSILTERIIKQAVKNGGNDCVTALVVKVLNIEGEIEAEQVQTPAAQSKHADTAPRSRNHAAHRRNLLIRKYASTAASILIIGLLVFAVYKLWERNQAREPDTVSLETTQQETQAYTYETTVAGTGIDNGGESSEPGDTAAEPDNQQAGTIKYTVKPGDSLFKISKQFYNDESKYKLIMEANGIKNPDKIQAGQELEIPDITQP